MIGKNRSKNFVEIHACFITYKDSLKPMISFVFNAHDFLMLMIFLIIFYFTGLPTMRYLQVYDVCMSSHSSVLIITCNAFIFSQY